MARGECLTCREAAGSTTVDVCSYHSPPPHSGCPEPHHQRAEAGGVPSDGRRQEQSGHGSEDQAGRPHGQTPQHEAQRVSSAEWASVRAFSGPTVTARCVLCRRRAPPAG